MSFLGWVHFHLLLSSLFFGRIRSQCAEDGCFYTPPSAGPKKDFANNPVYRLGDTINLEYDNGLRGSYGLYLWQEQSPQCATITGKSAVSWTITIHGYRLNHIQIIYQIPEKRLRLGKSQPTLTSVEGKSSSSMHFSCRTVDLGSILITSISQKAKSKMPTMPYLLK